MRRHTRFCRWNLPLMKGVGRPSSKAAPAPSSHRELPRDDNLRFKFVKRVRPSSIPPPSRRRPARFLPLRRTRLTGTVVRFGGLQIPHRYSGIPVVCCPAPAVPRPHHYLARVPLGWRCCLPAPLPPHGRLAADALLVWAAAGRGWDGRRAAPIN